MGTSGRGPSFWRSFWSYFGYGVGACVLLAIPLLAIDWLAQNLPFLRDLLDTARGAESPGVAIAAAIFLSVAALAALGFVLRQYLWDALARVPVVGTILSSGEQLAMALSRLDRTSRELVVWVTLPLYDYRALGVIMGRTRDEDGTVFATVYLLSGAGQFQGNTICSVQIEKLVFPGWTVDDAIVFSSSGGAVVPDHSRADAATSSS